MKLLSAAFTAVMLTAVIARPAKAEADDPFCAQSAQAPVVTSHTAKIEGRMVAYDATAGFLHVTAADGKSHACVFYTAYKRTDTPAAASRPLAFAFNGGPGSASLWLHLGALGPQRVDLGPAGLTPPQPFSLSDNQSSFLDLMDLVIIDPVATGFSHVDPGSEQDKFFGAKNDYQAIATFVQKYLTLSDRWASPKLIIGESYGGVRAALLTNYLQRGLDINIAGIIYVSPWMNSATTNFNDPGSELAYVSFLPTYATSAWYHRKLGGAMARKTLQEVRAEAEAFAFGPYLEALTMGNDLPADQAQQIAQRLADLTGFSPESINEHNLRLRDVDFFHGLLAEQHSIIGRYDSRVVEGAVGDPHDDAIDPSAQVLMPPFTAAMNDYLINQLAWHSSNPYVVMGNVFPWPINSDGSGYWVMDQLSAAMLDNPRLRIYVAAGLYDLAVPFAATEYNFRHLAPKQDLRSRVTIDSFESGHMVYTNPSSLVQLKAGVREFLAKIL